MNRGQATTPGPTRLPRQRRWWETERGFGFLCISPAILVLVAVNIFPLLWLIYLSFTKYSAQGNKPPVFNGGANYGAIATSSIAHEGLWVSLKFVGMGVLLQLAVGLGIAVIVNHLRRSREAVVTAIVMPMMVSTAVAGLFWKFLLDPSQGPVNGILSALKIVPHEDPILWFGPQFAQWSVIIVDSWMWVPFVALIASAALSSVPKELYEAAAVDRVDSWTFFWRICLPIISPVLLVAGLLRCLDLLRLFDIPWIMTAGGPGVITQDVPILIYKEAFTNSDTGRASAIAVLYLIIITFLAKWAVGRMLGDPKKSRFDWANPWFQGAAALVAIGLLWFLMGAPMVVAAVAILIVARFLCALPASAKRPLAGIASTAILFVMLAPLAFIAITSLKDRSEVFNLQAFSVTWMNYDALLKGTGSLGSKPFIEQLGTSLWVGVVSTILAVGMGTLAAYAFSRYKFKGHGDLLFFILSTKMLPAVAVAIPIVIMFREIKISGTPLSLVILYTAMNMALATWIMKAFLDKVPREYEEAAFLERCTPAQAFGHAILPLIKPAILTTALFCFLACWNEYAFALYMSSGQNLTAPPAITSVLGTGGVDWGYIAAGCMTLTIPALILTIMARKTLVLGVSFGVVDSK